MNNACSHGHATEINVNIGLCTCNSVSHYGPYMTSVSHCGL